jgi:hypothetical protein
MLAIIRFVWARISDAHTAFWFLPPVAVTSSAVIGLVASIFGGIGRLPIYLWIPLAASGISPRRTPPPGKCHPARYEERTSSSAGPT